MRKPDFVLVISNGAFYIHELNANDSNRQYSGPFRTSDEALKDLSSNLGRDLAMPIIQGKQEDLRRITIIG